LLTQVGVRNRKKLCLARRTQSNSESPPRLGSD
jgi:hypothetical protein